MSNTAFHLLELHEVTKRYRNVLAVDAVSFTVAQGTMFGLLGPNGAGKTSLIRIITTITGADSGYILFNNQRLNQNHVARIGYLPEERGLYRKMRVGEHLIYLARLKGLSGSETKARLKILMDRFEIGSWWNKKVEELSKGMQQKIQFISTVVHSPSLIILDEPFSGLDPINANLIKDEIFRLNAAGATVIFSTHRMEQVEQICENIVLINAGKKVLDGPVAEIKATFKRGEFQVNYEGDAPDLDDAFDVVAAANGAMTIRTRISMSPNDVLRALLNKGIVIQGFEEVMPSLNDIFIQTVNALNHV